MELSSGSRKETINEQLRYNVITGSDKGKLDPGKGLVKGRVAGQAPLRTPPCPVRLPTLHPGPQEGAGHWGLLAGGLTSALLSIKLLVLPTALLPTLPLWLVPVPLLP